MHTSTLYRVITYVYICNLALNFDNGFTGGREEPNAWLTDIWATWVADPPLAIVQSCKAPDSANTGLQKVTFPIF